MEGVDHLLIPGVGVHACTSSPRQAGARRRRSSSRCGRWACPGCGSRRGGGQRRGGTPAASGRCRERRCAGRRRSSRAARTAMRVNVQAATGGTLSLQGRAAPGSFLVRPTATCGRTRSPVHLRQRRPRRGRVVLGGAARGLGRRADQSLGGGDEEAGGPAEGGSRRLPRRRGFDTGWVVRRGGPGPPVPEKTPPKPADPATELLEAEETVRELAGARRYRHAPLRWSGSERQRFVRLAGDGSYRG